MSVALVTHADTHGQGGLQKSRLYINMGAKSWPRPLERSSPASSRKGGLPPSWRNWLWSSMAVVPVVPWAQESWPSPSPAHSTAVQVVAQARES